MKARQSLYSIIQFRPDEARAEGVNVGLVVVHPEGHVVKATFSGNNERVKKRFGRGVLDDVRLTSAKRALKNRLEGMAPEESALRAFISQEAGELVLLEPRPIVIIDLNVELSALFDELVGEIQPSQRKHRPTAPNLEKALGPLFMAGVPIDRDVKVALPSLSSELSFPYAFKNGVHNFIRPQGFALDEEDAIREAKELGADGRLLAMHPEGEQTRRLIVVGAFRNREIVPEMKSLLSALDSRLVAEEEIPILLDEIRRTAHR